MAAASASPKLTFSEHNVSEEVESNLGRFLSTLVPLVHFHIYLQGTEPLAAVERVLMYAPGRDLLFLGGRDSGNNPLFLTDMGTVAALPEWLGTGLPEASTLVDQAVTAWRKFLEAIKTEYGVDVIATLAFQDSLRDRLPSFLTQYYRNYADEFSMCSWCGMGAPAEERLGRCSKCKVRSYCRGTECQLRDWKAGHKKSCGKPGTSDNKPVFKKLPKRSPASSEAAAEPPGTEKMLLDEPSQPLNLAFLPAAWHPGDPVPDALGSLGPSGGGIARSCRVRLRGLPSTPRGVATTLKIRCNEPNVTLQESNLPVNGQECTVCCIRTEAVGNASQRRFRVRLEVCIDLRPHNDCTRTNLLPDGTRIGDQEPLLVQDLSPANVELIENRFLGEILRKPVPDGALELLKKGPPSVGTGEVGSMRCKQQGGAQQSKGGKSKAAKKNKKEQQGREKDEGGGETKARSGGRAFADDAAYYEALLLPLYARAWAVLMLMSQHDNDRPVALLDRLLGCGPYFFFPRDGDAAIDHLVPVDCQSCGSVGANSLALWVACLAPSGLAKFDKLLLAECGAASLDGGNSIDGTVGITLLNEALGRLEYRFMQIAWRKECHPVDYGSAVSRSQSCVPCLWLLHSKAADASAHDTDTSLEGTDGTGIASGTTPLMSACMSGNMEGACFLLLRGAAATLNEGDNAGCTALHYAANALHSIKRGDDEARASIKYIGPIIGLLAHLGADINVRDTSNITPLAAAVFMGSPVAARALLRRSAKLNIKVEINNTPPLSLESFCAQVVGSDRGGHQAEGARGAHLVTDEGSPNRRNLVDSARMVLDAIEAGRRRYVCDNPGCGKAEDGVGKFRRCARCREARYCSKECLAAHWKGGHKDVCQKSDADARKQKRYGIAGGGGGS